jgi:pyruvate dehydrogenase E2 component (dihydrolipoamide acetyltransferase)
VPAEDEGDAGTVVGAMESSNAVRSEQAVAIDGVKAMPAVRALAKKLKVDLVRVRATGADGVITLADVKAAAANPSTQSVAPAPSVPVVTSERPATPPPAFMPAPAGDDKDEPIRGVRRNMLRSMSAAHAEVVPTTLMDDADLSAWAPGEDITVRTLRALAVAAKTEPAMNAWLNAKEGTLRRHSAVHIGVAIDSADGLFVASLKHCDTRDSKTLRSELNRLRDGVRNRTLPPEDLSGYTLMFSNFGVFAGKYATPVVVPPCVCIVGAGRLYHAVVPVLGGMETHRMMPISLTFDHRAATGGEAARFLKAMIDDLQRIR